MKKIAIFGGTFNPIHNGHILLAKEMLERLGCDKMLVVPTKQPPHKTAPDLAPAMDRLNMCRLAFEGDRRYIISDIEIVREGPSYTAHTLSEIKQIYPGAEIYLIMGTDMLKTITWWYNYEDIFRLAVLCAAARDEDEMKSLHKIAKELSLSGARVRIEDINPLPVSSTQVRNIISMGGNPAELIPSKVYEYICRRGLYKNAGNN